MIRKPVIHFVTGILLVSLLAAACVPGSKPPPASNSPTPTWHYADLRSLHLDETAPISIAAAYTRMVDGELYIRLDVNGTSPLNPVDIYLALDSAAGGSSQLFPNQPAQIAWDKLLVLPASGSGYIENPDGTRDNCACFQSTRDSNFGDFTFELNSSSLPGNPRYLQIQAFLVKPGTNYIFDDIDPFHLDGSPPPRAPLLITFWNVLPGLTPAQALRRWDGAHTGPLGGRHGLNQLLQASAAARVPLTLLDLKTPSSLSALTAVGGMAMVQKLAAQGLLLLPQVAYGDPQVSSQALEYSRLASHNSRLSINQFVFSPSKENLASFSAAFAELPDQHHLSHAGSLKLIPLPEPVYGTSPTVDYQVDETGLSHTAINALLRAALSPDPTDLVTLGGSLPRSIWGDSRYASRAFNYITGHPWIWTLDAARLLSFPVGKASNFPECGDLICSMAPLSTEQSNHRTAVRDMLRSTHDNAITSLAWQAYLGLTTPVSSPDLQILNNVYLDQLISLAQAAKWASQPHQINDCSQDLDGDQLLDCILASTRNFFILSSHGAHLTLAVSIVNHQPIEWIGPSSQFAVGMGDPLSWHLDRNLAADPDIISGAFADQAAPWEQYRIQMKPDTIIFISADGLKQKRYQLQANELRVDYSGFAEIQTSIPLIMSQPSGQQSGWDGYSVEQPQTGSIFISKHKRTAFSINTSGALSYHNSLDSLSYLSQPENPDRDYPPEHFLPFPVNVIEISGNRRLSIDLTFPQAD